MIDTEESRRQINLFMLVVALCGCFVFVFSASALYWVILLVGHLIN